MRIRFIKCPTGLDREYRDILITNFDYVPRVGDFVEYRGIVYKVIEVTWRLDPTVPNKRVAVFLDFEAEV